MIYLLAHVEKFAQYGGTLRVASARWAEQLLLSRETSNITNFLEDGTVLKVEENSNTINIVMQAGEDEMGGLIAAINSVVSNSKLPIHFYLVLPEASMEHFKY